MEGDSLLVWMLREETSTSNRKIVMFLLLLRPV
jgi:hypothetical protein